MNIFYEKCSKKVCGEDDLRNTLDMQEAKRRHEKEKESLKEMQDALRRLRRYYD